MPQEPGRLRVHPFLNRKIDSLELNDIFWGQAEYCGYLRHTFHRNNSITEDDLFINDTYARIVGLGREEMMQR
jgi:hypothetical protein